MVLKKFVSLGLHWLCSVVSWCRQTCPFGLFEPSSETVPCLGQKCQFDTFVSSKMTLSDDSVMTSLTDARYPDRFSDNGGSSGCWIGKHSEHVRRLEELNKAIEILDLYIEMLEQELTQKSNSRQSRLQEIKEKIDDVQNYFL